MYLDLISLTLFRSCFIIFKILFLFFFSAAYMMLLNDPQFTTGIGQQFEELITKLEDYENQSKHFDSLQQFLDIKDDENLLAHTQKANEESSKVVSDMDMDKLGDSFGKLEQCESETGQCCQGMSTCLNEESSCVLPSSSNKELVNTINREPDTFNVAMKFREYAIAANHCETLEKFVLENMSLILIPFNESVKYKILKLFSQ